MAIFDSGIFDTGIFDAAIPADVPLSVYRNGVSQALTLNMEQLGALSLGMAAYDGQVGMGQITVGGDPGWVAGDRITVYGGASFLYCGFVMDHSRSRGPEVLAVQSTYQLMDANRQLIGRRVVDWNSPENTAHNKLVSFYNTFLTDLTFTTTWVDADSTLMPERTYTGDGIMDLAADLILYTGKTLFLLAVSDNHFELHFHDLTDGTQAGLSIVDDQSLVGPLGVRYGGVGATFGGVAVVYSYAAAVTSFPPRQPLASFSAADLKNDNEVRNGVTDVAGDNPGSVTRHGAGGLHFEAVLDYSGINEDSLVLVANTILDVTGADERPSYTCSIGPLTGAQAALIPAGCLVPVTSAVFGGTSVQRVAHVTLTLSRDERGQAVPGRWDAALELAYPLRLPGAVMGMGMQGGDAGRLSDPPTWTDTIVSYDDPAMPAGSSTTVTAQLIDQDRTAVPVEGVVLTWTLYQWTDEAATIAGTDYTIADATSVTDISGLATTVVSHVTAGAVKKWWVTAGP